MIRSRELAEEMRDCGIALCEHLGLQPRFTAFELKERIEQDLRTSILVSAEFLPGSVFGVCAHLRGAYAIFYRDDSSAAQRERIIFHELGHIVLGHLNGQQQLIVMRDGAGDSHQEHEAEAFAEFMTTYALLEPASPLPDTSATSTHAAKTSLFGRWVQRVTR